MNTSRSSLRNGTRPPPPNTPTSHVPPPSTDHYIDRSSLGRPVWAEALAEAMQLFRLPLRLLADRSLRSEVLGRSEGLRRDLGLSCVPNTGFGIRLVEHCFEYLGTVGCEGNSLDHDLFGGITTCFSTHFQTILIHDRAFRSRTVSDPPRGPAGLCTLTRTCTRAEQVESVLLFCFSSYQSSCSHNEP